MDRSFSSKLIKLISLQIPHRLSAVLYFQCYHNYKKTQVQNRPLTIFEFFFHFKVKSKPKLVNVVKPILEVQFRKGIRSHSAQHEPLPDLLSTNKQTTQFHSTRDYKQPQTTSLEHISINCTKLKETAHCALFLFFHDSTFSILLFFHLSLLGVQIKGSKRFFSLFLFIPPTCLDGLFMDNST